MENIDKAFWTNKDIMNYVGCSKNTATQIRKKAILYFDGFNSLMPKKTKREAVLKVLEMGGKKGI